MSGGLSRAHRWFPLIALALTLALFGYSLGSPSYLDEVARLETDTLAPTAALDGRLSFTSRDAAGYWARQYGIERFMNEFHSSDTLEVYTPPLPAAFESLLLGLCKVPLPVMRLLQLLLHVAVALLLFRLTWRYTASSAAALTAGIIFAVHPCHTLAVTTLAGLGPITAALLTLLSIEFFERRNERRFFGCLSPAAYALACLSDMSVILLPLFLLWRSIELKDGNEALREEAIRSTRRFFVAAAALIILRLALWPSLTGVNSIEWWYFLKPFENYMFWLLTLMQTLFYYTAIIPPVPVSFTLAGAGQWGLAAILSLAFLGLLPYAARRLADRAAMAGYLLFWVAGLGLIGSMNSFEASYLPSVGISLALGALAGRLVGKTGKAGRTTRWAMLLLVLVYLPPSVMHIVDAQAMWRFGGKTAQGLAERLLTAHPEPQAGETIYLFNVWLGDWYFDRRVRTLYGREDLKVRLMTVDPFPATEGSPLPQDLFTSKLTGMFSAALGVDELEVAFEDHNRIKARMLSGAFFSNLMDWSPQYFVVFPPRGEKYRHADFSAEVLASDNRNMPTELEFVLDNPGAPAAFFKLEDGQWKSIERPQP